MSGGPEARGPMSRDDLFGVVLAGGGSRRFGQEKALYPLAGVPMARWALEALIPWTAGQGVLTENPRVGEALGRPWQADRIRGKGPLGGVHSALAWAREVGLGGVFVLACDLPLVPGALVGRILAHWPPGALAVVPGSQGPLGMEPLCAAYAVEALPRVESQIRAGDLSMAQALARIAGHRLPPSTLGSAAELAAAFTNVNTPQEARRAQQLLIESSASRPQTPSQPEES